jgi:hypothetical protein
LLHLAAWTRIDGDPVLGANRMGPTPPCRS